MAEESFFKLDGGVVVKTVEDSDSSASGFVWDKDSRSWRPVPGSVVAEGWMYGIKTEDSTTSMYDHL